MRKKLGTILDEELVFKAKQVALSQKQSLSRILEEALRVYLHTVDRKDGRKSKNVTQSTRGIMQISQADLKAVMEEEGIKSLVTNDDGFSKIKSIYVHKPADV